MPERNIAVSRESLLDDHRSELAQDRLGFWDESWNTNNLYMVWACSDSRLVLPYKAAIHIYSLTAGGPRSPYTNLMKDPSIKAQMIVCHHDGHDVRPGHCPGGCGARAAKANLENGNGRSGAVDRFVDKHVWHSDLVKQAYTAGAFTAYRSGKPTLATSQDNRDLTIYPLASFEDEGRDTRTEVPQHFLTAEQYFQDYDEIVYKNGLPVLRKGKVPAVFDEALAENIQLCNDLAVNYPHLRAMQESQNPSLLVVSTDIRPLRVRYPQTTEVPGSVFRISVPLQAIDSPTLVQEEHLGRAFQQADYPVTHFSNLHTILIETRSREKSFRAATDLAGKRWMRKWLSSGDHKILVGQAIRGHTISIEEFNHREVL